MKETKTKTTAKKTVSKPASKAPAKFRTKTPAKSQAKTPADSSKNKVALSQKIRLFWDTVRGSNDTGTIFGILLMTVPFVLSMITWSTIQKKWGITSETTFTLTPNLSTTLVGALIYASYLLRYGFFKKDSAADVFWTIIQGVLDMWVLSSLCAIVVGGKPWQIPFINVDRSAILIFTIIMSWVGMKSVAGFMWIFLILGTIPRLSDANLTMGMAGAVFIICTVLGLILQIKNLLSVHELTNDLKFVLTSDVKASKTAAKKVVRITSPRLSPAEEKTIVITRDDDATVVM